MTHLLQPFDGQSEWQTCEQWWGYGKEKVWSHQTRYIVPKHMAFWADFPNHQVSYRPVLLPPHTVYLRGLESTIWLDIKLFDVGTYKPNTHKSLIANPNPAWFKNVLANKFMRLQIKAKIKKNHRNQYATDQINVSPFLLGSLWVFLIFSSSSRIV